MMKLTNPAALARFTPGFLAPTDWKVIEEFDTLEEAREAFEKLSEAERETIEPVYVDESGVICNSVGDPIEMPHLPFHLPSSGTVQ